MFGKVPNKLPVLAPVQGEILAPVEWRDRNSGASSHGSRLERIDLLFRCSPVIMAAVDATLAQSAEQTLRKRQVKGSNPLGGLQRDRRPQPWLVGAFVIGEG